MKIYDDLIQRVYDAVEKLPRRELKAAEALPWRDEGENRLVLAKEAAYELGADSDGYAATLVTGDPNNVGEETVTLFGNDLTEINGNSAFARIAVVYAEGIDEKEDSAYKEVQSVDFAKYKVHPAGYMLRISSESGQERVRVARKAVAEGVTFAAIGRAYIDAYKKNPLVKKVKIMFFTGEAAKCADFKEIAKKYSERTSALNRILNEVMLDCSVCALKPVCDEVEELREKHFGKLNKR